jgi:hypothetical protein
MAYQRNRPRITETTRTPRGTDTERRGDERRNAPPGNAALSGLLRPTEEGVPLPADVQAKMQLRLGHDLGSVRIHDSAESARAARDIDAVAYTTGQDIVLGPDAPAPTSRAGEALLAHELSHVVQQREATRIVEAVSGPGEAAEVAAETAARTGGPPPATGGAVHAVQRQPPPGKERRPVKREEVEGVLTQYLQDVLDTQGRRTIDKTPQVVEAITSLFKDDPVRQASVAEWLKGTTDGTPAGLAHQVAAKLPAEIPDDRLEKIKTKPKAPSPDTRPKTAGEAAGSVVVDSTVAPVVRNTKLSKDLQDKIISAARSAVAEGIIAILDNALDGLGIGGPTKDAIHAAGEAALKQQPGTAMDRQQEGAGSPYRQAPPPSVAPGIPNAPGQHIIMLPPIKWDFPGTTPRKPAAQPPPKTDPAVEKAAAATDPKALIPDGVTGKDADVFGSAVDFALDVARKLDDAQAKKNGHLMIDMGAQYESVKDRGGLFQRVKDIVFAMRDALPHHAALVERVSFTIKGRVAFSFSLHPSPE